MNKNEKFYNSFLSQEYRKNIFDEARIKRVTALIHNFTILFDFICKYEIFNY